MSMDMHDYVDFCACRDAVGGVELCTVSGKWIAYAMLAVCFLGKMRFSFE